MPIGLKVLQATQVSLNARVKHSLLIWCMHIGCGTLTMKCSVRAKVAFMWFCCCCCCCSLSRLLHFFSSINAEQRYTIDQHICGKNSHSNVIHIVCILESRRYIAGARQLNFEMKKILSFWTFLSSFCSLLLHLHFEIHFIADECVEYCLLPISVEITRWIKLKFKKVQRLYSCLGTWDKRKAKINVVRIFRFFLSAKWLTSIFLVLHQKCWCFIRWLIYRGELFGGENFNVSM